MRDQHGMTLVELVVVVAVASILVAVTVAYAASWMARETMNGAAYDVQGLMQLARIEAVSRNHDCRFVVDTATGDLQVLDTQGTTTTDDDVVLHTRTLPVAVSFDRPDVGDPVTLEYIGGTASYQTVFTSTGSASSGTGGVYLRGGERFGSVAIHAAGAVELTRWNGLEWHVGL